MTVRIFLILSLWMFMPSAFAEWKCRTENNHDTWFGIGQKQAQAQENAMRFCIKNASQPEKCVIDWCQRL